MLRKNIFTFILIGFFPLIIKYLQDIYLSNLVFGYIAYIPEDKEVDYSFLRRDTASLSSLVQKAAIYMSSWHALVKKELIYCWRNHEVGQHIFKVRDQFSSFLYSCFSLCFLRGEVYVMFNFIS